MRYKVLPVPDENGTLCYQVFRRTWYFGWKALDKHKFFYLNLAKLHMQECIDADKNAANYILLITAITTVTVTLMLTIISKLMGY